MDIADTVAPKSDQMNADDLLTGPRTFTITSVVVRGGEQPVSVYLAEFPDGRPFKPSKGMRRVMIEVWGKESATYPGKRLTLFRNPKVRYAGQEIGGIQISHMSHLSARKTLALTESQKSRVPFVVDPLPDDAPTSPVVSADTLAELEAMFTRKGIPAAARLGGVNQITGGNASALEVITEAQAQQVLTALAARLDVEAD